MAFAASGHVHIEGLQTAQPTRVAPPGRARAVSVSAPPPLPAAALQRRVRVVLYYRGDGAPCREEAVWVKESLSEALADHPEMAGRLRRRAADGSAWEVKLNDAGVRLVLATADGTVDDFLAGADDGDERARREAALAPWTDVNAEDPDMSALCFLQLTRFQGDGGYAVGVSCSLMLADPLSLARFLLSWSRTHAEMKAKNEVATNPMLQYASYFQRPDVMTRRIRSIPLDSVGGDIDVVQTVLFRATGSPPADHYRTLARACLDQASHKLGAAAKVPRFSVIAVASKGEGDNPAGVGVETFTTDALPESGAAEHKLEAVQWQELGLEELVLRGTKPVHVSYSIVTSNDEGLAVVMPDGAGFLVTATVPK